MEGLCVPESAQSRGCFSLQSFRGAEAEKAALVVYLPANKAHVQAQLERVRGPCA